MDIIQMPKGQSSGEYIAQSIGKGLEALANMKMQEYQNKQLIKQQQEAQEYQYSQQRKLIDQMGPEWQPMKQFIGLPGSDKMMQYYMLGKGQEAAAAAQNQGQGEGTIAQTMGTLQPPQVPGTGLGTPANNMQAIQNRPPQAPTGAGNIFGTVSKGMMNTPQIQAQAAQETRREAFQSGETEKKQKFQTEQADKAANRQEDSQIRQDNIKFVKESLPEYRAYAEVGEKAKAAEDILRKHGKEFPTGIAKYSDAQWQKLLIQNPYVRDYMALINDIRLLKLKEMKGQPREWESQLINDTKAWVDQPLETQMERHRILQQDAEKAAQRLDYQNAVDRSNKKGGRPRDLASAMSEYQLVQMKPLATPAPYRVGTILPAKYSPNGKRNKVVMVDGEKQFEELP